MLCGFSVQRFFKGTIAFHNGVPFKGTVGFQNRVSFKRPLRFCSFQESSCHRRFAKDPQAPGI